MMNRKLNWVPGAVSPLKFRSIAPKIRASLPVRANLKYLQSPIVDQGDAGSCVANAVSSALEFLQLKGIKDTFNVAPEEFSAHFDPISRLFLYFNNRVLEGSPYYDSGSTVQSGVDSIKKYGMCREFLWPYDLGFLYSTPSRAAYSEASHHKELDSYSIQSIQEIKQCIAGGYPVLFGTAVCDSFMMIRKNGVYAGPNEGEQELGGHCMLIVAFDDYYQSFTVKNSWGTGFGDHGYCYLSYKFAQGFGDMHTIR